MPTPPTRPLTYDFGPAALPSGQAPRAGAAVRLPPVLLAAVEAVPAFDSTLLYYRDAGTDARVLRPYAQARWSMAPAQLVRARLQARIGQERAVIASGEGTAALALRVQLEEFSQVYDALPSASRTAPSRGVVRLRATLSTIPGDGRGSRPVLLAQQVFERQRPAASADAGGGVQALTEATDAALDDLAAWLREQPAPAVAAPTTPGR